MEAFEEFRNTDIEKNWSFFNAQTATSHTLNTDDQGKKQK